MSFSEYLEHASTNPILAIRLNDLVLLMIASFFIGRFYEKKTHSKNSFYSHRTSHSSEFPTTNLLALASWHETTENESDTVLPANQ